MMAGHGSDPDGGPARHIPVLLSEVMAALGPMADRLVVDGTFGGTTSSSPGATPSSSSWFVAFGLAALGMRRLSRRNRA
jgi:MYXO-CTERM domain-containing protein